MLQIIIGIVVWCSTVYAEDPLLNATTLTDLERANDYLHQVWRYKQVCEAELRNHEVPVHCFLYMKEARGAEPSQKFLYEWLQNRCIAVLDQSPSSYIYAIKYKNDLSGLCKGRVIEMRSVLRYKQQKADQLSLETQIRTGRLFE